MRSPHGSRPSEMQRWAAKVRLPTHWKEESCWEWTGCRSPRGYGRFRWDQGRGDAAHRYAYERFLGPIPDGLVIDHLCRNPGCVNPGHLEAVTQRENVLRGVGLFAQQARRTHCPRGHIYAGDNVRVQGGSRVCLTCISDRKKEKYHTDPAHRAHIAARGRVYAAANRLQPKTRGRAK